MSTWKEMATINMSAAKLLHDHDRHRPSTTRSYYAVYCRLTDVLTERHHSEFRHEGNNPAHEQLWALTSNNLQLKRARDLARLRRTIGNGLRSLLAMRITAEYVPGRTIDARDSRDALRLASGILRDLEETE